VNKFLAAIALLGILTAPYSLADNDAANGQKLYLGNPSASFPIGGSYPCKGCHDVNDKVTPMNVAFRGAAGQPELINDAINFLPASTGQMYPLFGLAGTYPLSDSDESDLAAYINSIVNPGGTGGSGPTFSASPASADFGAIAVATQSNTVTFTIKNSGASGTINSASSSNNTEFLVTGGTCLSVPHTVAQNGSCTVQVVFKPSVTGSRLSTLSILDNGTPNPLTVTLTGTGSASAPAQPNLSVPPSASFGTQTLFIGSAPVALTIRNIGTATAIVNSVTSSSSEFPVTSSTCNGALVVNSTCTVNVVFDPTSSGARSATLTVSSNGIGSPQSITLSGTGAAAGGATGSGTKVTVVEYYDATFNHYFITSDLTEIGLLGGPLFPDWQPTGLTFNGYSKVSPPSGTVGICRFFNDHFLGTSTHFYAPHGFGCEATIADFPDWTLEDSQLFFAFVPDTAGNCQAGTIPVYRLYNNGMGGAPNHRFTISLAVRQTMLDKGYTPEGNGIGVGMCVPQ